MMISLWQVHESEKRRRVSDDDVFKFLLNCSWLSSFVKPREAALSYIGSVCDFASFYLLFQPPIDRRLDESTGDNVRLLSKPGSLR